MRPPVARNRTADSSDEDSAGFGGIKLFSLTGKVPAKPLAAVKKASVARAAAVRPVAKAVVKVPEPRHAPVATHDDELDSPLPARPAHVTKPERVQVEVEEPVVVEPNHPALSHVSPAPPQAAKARTAPLSSHKAAAESEEESDEEVGASAQVIRKAAPKRSRRMIVADDGDEAFKQYAKKKKEDPQYHVCAWPWSAETDECRQRTVAEENKTVTIVDATSQVAVLDWTQPEPSHDTRLEIGMRIAAIAAAEPPQRWHARRTCCRGRSRPTCGCACPRRSA